MLQIIFKDGETRNLNVTPDFYLSDKKSKETIADKCYAIAHDFGGTIYKMSLYKDGKEQFSRENLANNPAENTSTLRVVLSDLQKKEKRVLRNELKRSKFTLKMNFSTGITRNLLTGVEMKANLLLAA